MIAVFGMALASAGILALSLGLARVASTIHRGVTRCSEALEGLSAACSELSGRESPASSELAGRLEAVERRVELALQDLNTQLRRLGQRRRQLLAAGEDLDEPLQDQEQLELARQLVSRPPAAPEDNGRPPRLVKRR